jgi:carbonic anhydrase/acetyltransferase-like protein (isoleucine patch superfamily)
MDIERVLALFPGTNAPEWKRHQNLNDDSLDGRGGWVHYLAEVAPNMHIEAGAVVGPRVRTWLLGYVSAGAVIRDHALLHAYAFVGKNVQVAPGLKIGRNAVIGDGAIVTDDVPDRAIVRGDFSAYPAIPRLNKRVYAAARAEGALDMTCWHASCGTAHCWAGWITFLGINESKRQKEENCMGVAAAAAVLLAASDPTATHVPDFSEDRDENDALAEMKERAKREAV